MQPCEAAALVGAAAGGADAPVWPWVDRRARRTGGGGCGAASVAGGCASRHRPGRLPAVPRVSKERLPVLARPLEARRARVRTCAHTRTHTHTRTHATPRNAAPAS
jgi:hypothetical protein